MNILLLKKINCDYSNRAEDFLRATEHTITVVNCERRYDQFPDDLVQLPDVIFSFKNYMIVPKSITQQVFCVNFHPGPPEHPGSCSANWALYNGDKTFGVTAHIMNELVDNGLILRIKRFDIETDCTLMQLLRQADEKLLELFREVVSDITTKWQGPARRGRDLDRLIEQNPNDPRVIRATKFIKQ